MLTWRVVPIGYNMHPGIPETAVIVNGEIVLALIRQDKGEPVAGAAISYDAGETFGPTELSDLACADSKIFAGTLPTGHHYVIYNATADAPGDDLRNQLLIGIMPPGEFQPFQSVHAIAVGVPEALASQLAEMGETATSHAWAYPEAVEHEGELFVTFSQNKRHCWLARMPVASLVG